MCHQADGHSVIVDGSLGFAGENTAITGEKWFERVDVLHPIEYRFGGKDLGVIALNGFDDLEDAALRLDLRRDV